VIELGKRGFCGVLGLTRASTAKSLNPRRMDMERKAWLTRFILQGQRWLAIWLGNH
jgi:hypothetical protein